VEAARWATAEVRQMANAQDQAMPWSPLGRAINPVQLGMPTAADYTNVLLTALTQLNTGAASRSLEIAFTPGTTETHQLVEFQRPDTSAWMLLDPMFGLTINRTIDGASATAAEVNAATVALAWADVTYDFLAPAGNAYVTSHYIDYPLFYLNIAAGTPPSPAPYLLEESTPVSVPGIYVIGCEGQAQTSAVIDGNTVTVSCPGPDTTSGAFFASSIAVPSGGSLRVFTLRRFLF
jgi:hypothetical protein